jgi:RNA polymerase sigma-70 factor (ECF subfamily)
VSLRRILRDRRHARLLEAARVGDSEAFRMLYRELLPPVRGFLASRLAQREDVEDLTSQAFHRLLDHLDRFDRTRGSVLGWLLTMTHHALVDHFRSIRPMVPANAAEVASAGVPDDPLERLIREEHDGTLRQAVGGLEPALRRMFELRYGMDLSYREIADLLGIREDAVKQRFSRAHRRLRAAMDKGGEAHHA